MAQTQTREPDYMVFDRVRLVHVTGAPEFGTITEITAGRVHVLWDSGIKGDFDVHAPNLRGWWMP